MASKRQQVKEDIKRIEWLQEMYREWMTDKMEADLNELNDNFDEDYYACDHIEPTLH